MPDHKRNTPAAGIPYRLPRDEDETPVETVSLLLVREDIRELRTRQTQDVKTLHGRIADIERDQKQLSRDMTALRETSSGTAVKVDTLLTLAAEDRHERRLADDRRAKTDTEGFKLARVKVSSRAKVIVAAIGAAAASAGYIVHYLTH